MRDIFYQSSLPRAGSTLLQNIIGQNPDFYVTPTSGVLDLVYGARNNFEEIPEILNPGSSILLRHGTLHKVNPVTKGIRKTLSYWYYGPRFI